MKHTKVKRKRIKKLELPRPMFGVLIQEKERWQKQDCITHAWGGDCRRISTLQAQHGNCYIRCCDNMGCVRRAANIAKAIKES